MKKRDNYQDWRKRYEKNFKIFYRIICAIETDKKVQPEYHVGNLEKGETISQLFELTGTSEGAGYAYEDGTFKMIYGQQLSNGGWVAWSSSTTTYVYTDSDVGLNQIRGELADKLGELLVLH